MANYRPAAGRSPLRRNGMVCPSSQKIAPCHQRGAAYDATNECGHRSRKELVSVVGLDEGGAPILRKKLNRAQLADYVATAPRCIVAMEFCPGSQYLGRVFTAAGHEVRILPAQFVKPYLNANKTILLMPRRSPKRLAGRACATCR